MSGEVVRWGAATQIERGRRTQLAGIFAQTDAAMARTAGVAEVGQAAMMGTLGLALMKREAELMVPDAAAYLNLVMMSAAQGMSQQVTRLAGQW